jgi:hypothetical protein
MPTLTVGIETFIVSTRPGCEDPRADGKLKAALMKRRLLLI